MDGLDFIIVNTHGTIHNELLIEESERNLDPGTKWERGREESRSGRQGERGSDVQIGRL